MTRDPQKRSSKGKLTGKKVALIFFGAFGVIIAANLTLAFNAIGTFSGLVVPNSYVASQSFDRNREAQEALGWQVDLAYREGNLYIEMKDKSDQTVRPWEMAASIGRPTTAASDRDLALVTTIGGFAAPIDLDPGNWRVVIRAQSEDGTDFYQHHTLYVSSTSGS